MKSPSLTREWDADVRVLAGVEALADGTVKLQQVRDWRYTRTDVIDTRYFDATFDPDDITNLWMYEQNLDGSGLIAHTFLVFEFNPSYGPARYLGISVETRREVGEKYSVLGGMMRRFEVTHIWATERDLVRRRVEFLDYPLTRFQLNVPPAIRARIFRKLTLETQQLASTPQWYHTALNNCTSSLIQYVNESEPGAIPRHYSNLLTGQAAEYLGRLGYLDTDSEQTIDRAFLASNPLRDAT
ncbi:MAG: DUF4105 domain-containing protein [Gammaproteobacteria bacterium]